MNLPMVYGISGRRGHGKDTLAKFTQAKESKFQVMHFAGLLKELCMKVFSLTSDQVWTDAGKEAFFSEPVNMDDFVPALREATGLDIKPHNKSAISAREILQYVGTDYVRSAKDDYWIMQLKAKILTAGGYVLIPDTRYPNEELFLRELGGKIIKVERPGKEDKDKASQHASETSIDQIKADLTVPVPEGRHEEVLNQVADVLVKEGALEDLKRSAWAKVQLEKIVTGFNEIFTLWEEHWKMGANIGIDYHSNKGKKTWYVMDVMASLYNKPEVSVMASAGQMLRSLDESGDMELMMAEKYGNKTPHA